MTRRDWTGPTKLKIMCYQDLLNAEPANNLREVADVRIVNPTYGVSAAGGEAQVGQPFDWKTDPIALFSNSKPNARELMDGLKAKLADLRPVDNIDFIYKPSASQPAPADTMDEVVQKYRAALLALAD